jgi:uncharacterized protein YjiS (DUF1127 family)
MTRDALASLRPLAVSDIARRSTNDAGQLAERAAALGRMLAVWRHRARTRAELDLIPSHRLNDLPFDTSTIWNEREKPFWKE